MLWLDGGFELICLPLLAAEFERVLLRPKFRTYATEFEVRSFLELLNRLATLVSDPPPLPGVTPDPKDDYSSLSQEPAVRAFSFLATAISATWLIRSRPF